MAICSNLSLQKILSYTGKPLILYQNRRTARPPGRNAALPRCSPGRSPTICRADSRVGNAELPGAFGRAPTFSVAPYPAADVLLHACSNDNTPAPTPTPTTPTSVTDTFVGPARLRLRMNLRRPASGIVTASLVSLTPDTALVVGLALGTWNDRLPDDRAAQRHAVITGNVSPPATCACGFTSARPKRASMPGHLIRPATRPRTWSPPQSGTGTPSAAAACCPARRRAAGCRQR